jgi:cytochrome P450
VSKPSPATANPLPTCRDPPLSIIKHGTDLRCRTLCGTFVPKGTLFYFAMNVASCSKAIWGEDTETCIPERWDNPDGEASDPYAFQTFSQGPRICIGKTFAMMNIKTFLVEMVHRFRFIKSPQMEALGGQAPALQCPTFTYVPKGRLEVVFERI